MVESCNCTLELTETNRFTCGGCDIIFSKICCLHDHLREHVPGGSYHYDHVSKTAFPKYDTVCQYAQTSKEELGKHSNGVKERATSNGFVKEENHHKKKKRKTMMMPENIMKRYFIKNKCSQSKNKGKLSVREKTLQKQERKRAINSKYEDKSNLVEESSDGYTSKLGRNSKCETQNEVPEVDFTDEEIRQSIIEQLGFNKLKQKDTEIFTNSDKELNDTITKIVGPRIALKETIENMPFKKRKISKSIESCKLTRRKNSNHSKTLNTIVDLNPIDDKTYDDTKQSKMKDSDILFKGGMNKVSCLDTIDVSSMDTSEISERDQAKLDKKLQHCKICDLMVSKQNWNNHKKGHKAKQEFVCEKCGKAFAKRLSLNRHLITHENLKPWRCSVCSAQFCQKKEYTLHLAGHAGHKPFICNVCDKGFLCKASLLTHQANIHMGQTNFECEICGRRFFKKSSYTTHIAIHFEAKLKCSFCDRKFKDKTGLKRHEKTHTGVKRFKCHICKHGFVQSTPFWLHMEKIHDICRIKLKEKLKEVREENKRLGIKTDILALPDGVDIKDLLTANDTEKLVKERTDQNKGTSNNLQRSFDTPQMNILEPPHLLKWNTSRTSVTKVLHGNNNSDLTYSLRKTFSMSHKNGNTCVTSELLPTVKASVFSSFKASLVPNITVPFRPELSANMQDSLDSSSETAFITSTQASTKSELPPRVQASVVPCEQSSLRTNMPASVPVSLVPSVQASLVSGQVSVRSRLLTKGQTSLICSDQAPKRSEPLPSLQASCVPSVEAPFRSVVPTSSIYASHGQCKSSFISSIPLASASVADNQSTPTPQPLRPVYLSNKSSDALKNLQSLEPSPFLIKLNQSGNSN